MANTCQNSSFIVIINITIIFIIIIKIIVVDVIIVIMNIKNKLLQI